MPEENQNQKPIQAPEQADPKYKETLLLYNEQNGAVEAVSDPVSYTHLTLPTIYSV